MSSFSGDKFEPLPSSVQSLSRVQLFATPRTAARQASLSFTASGSLLKFMSIESVMPSNHLILCCPLLFLPSVFPNIRVFSNEWLFASSGPSIGSSASASIFPLNNQGWLPLGLADLISLQCVEYQCQVWRIELLWTWIKDNFLRTPCYSVWSKPQLR